jgi:hypothetical protein
LTVRKTSFLHLQFESISLRKGALFWERWLGFVSHGFVRPYAWIRRRLAEMQVKRPARHAPEVQAEL